MIDPRLIAVDGPPGSGKTRTITEHATNEWLEENPAVIVYTNEAANVLNRRAPTLTAGTIYSLSWPYVSPFAKGKLVGSSSNVTYGNRRVHHAFDPALTQYVKDAPSNRPEYREDALAVALHAWDGEGEPPFKLNDETPKRALKFILPIARWVEAGCPMPEEKKIRYLAIDEAQDMSALELRASLGMLHESGTAIAYGDPGQSIFADSKGVAEGALPHYWTMSKTQSGLSKGYRVGDPVATIASRILWSYFERPASTFRAEHKTDILVWDGDTRPVTGLCLGYSRYSVAKAFTRWGLRQTGVVPNIANADKELVLSTGHAAKGAEADLVFLLPWSRKALKRVEERDPATLRLLYVMLTRARKRVFLPRALKARLPL